ncbi:MAG: ERF family protein [Candidatus Eremiobacter antarcticus]|nr:ERF family protein [Candidatus Eremiobacteraeota bacterium]MBC5808826.1 ERF family protein [Candidatus Eremiobacteraeota bacterium]
MIAASESTALISEALALAQAEMQNPKRDRTVTVRTKTGGTYSFPYATLGAIIECVRKPLTKNGLSFTQMLVAHEGGFRLCTRLMHASGEWIESVAPLLIGPEGGNQAFGSALTYMRRYALTAALGLAADEDDDGNAGEGNEARVSERATNGYPQSAPQSSPQAQTRTEAVKNKLAPPSEKPIAMVSPDQVKDIYDLAGRLALVKGAFSAVVRAQNKRGVSDVRDLNYIEASQLLDHLKMRLNLATSPRDERDDELAVEEPV